MTQELVEMHWPKIIYQSHIRNYMKEYVQGQQNILDLFAYIGHLYSLQLHGLKCGIRKKSMPKVNCLLTGPTGYGKTFVVKKFADSLELPYMKVDCSSVRAEGWHGTNLSEYIFRFLQKSPYGFGVLHLDEIDKIGISGDNNSAGKLDLQMGLLDLLDGDYCHIYDRDRITKSIELANANNCLVIMSGSFQHVRNYDDKQEKEEEIINRPIGFTADFNAIVKKEKEPEKTWKERLKDLGFIHELASRIVCQEELEKYDEQQLRKIIMDGKESAYHKYLNVFGQQHTLEDSDIDDIVKRVQDCENGLRDLESIMFEKFYKKRDSL